MSADRALSREHNDLLFKIRLEYRQRKGLPPESAVMVTGSRELRDHELVYQALGRANPTLVIHGGYFKGADYYARSWCRATGTPEVEVVANWNFHGQRAGPIRNHTMAMVASRVGAGCPLIVLAFFGVNGENRGTRNAVEAAQGHGLEVQSFHEGPQWRLDK